MLMFLTLLSASLAIVMSVVAWRAVSGERRRSAARVAALAHAIHAADDLLLREERATDVLAPPHRRAARSVAPPAQSFAPEPDLALRDAGTPELFAAAEPAPSGSRYAVALAAAGFIVASIAATAIVFSGEPSSAVTAPSGRAAAPAAAPRPAVPLELVALSHERSGGTLTVRGVVRNPSGGSPMDRLMAVVFAFDADGGFLASGRAAVESPALIPGGQSTFVVAVPVAGDVARYRVSFRSGDRIVAHLDKRSGS